MAIILLVQVLVEHFPVASFVNSAVHRTIINVAIAFITVPSVMNSC